jgi:hypothetical protein
MTQFKSINNQFALENLQVINKTENFISGVLFEKFYLQFEKNIYDNFQITYCEKLQGQKFVICNNWLTEINNLRILKFVNPINL